MANTTKKKKITRKAAKRYDMVTFETPIFDGEFTFPSPKQMPLKVIKAITQSDVDALIQWLEAAGVTEEELEAFSELDAEELETFMASWNDGHIAAPKS